MSLLVIKPVKRFPPLPRVICIDNQPLCMMKGQPIAISLPAGTYKVTVRSGGFRFIEGSVMVSLDAASERRMTVGDREKWWNALFNIDLAYQYNTTNGTFSPYDSYYVTNAPERVKVSDKRHQVMLTLGYTF